MMVALEDVASEIATADLLLFRGSGIISKAIRTVSRGIHSHAAKASWHNGRLMCLEVREFRGGRAVTLESQVARYPGRIDVFRVNAQGRWPEYDRDAADEFMWGLTGVSYGYGSIMASAMMHLPIVRWMVDPPTADEVFDTRLPVCSAACAMADGWAGKVDPVPNLASWAVTPADLARSMFYQYLFTLQ